MWNIPPIVWIPSLFGLICAVIGFASAYVQARTTAAAQITVAHTNQESAKLTRLEDANAEASKEMIKSRADWEAHLVEQIKTQNIAILANADRITKIDRQLDEEKTARRLVESAHHATAIRLLTAEQDIKKLCDEKAENLKAHEQEICKLHDENKTLKDELVGILENHKTLKKQYEDLLVKHNDLLVEYMHTKDDLEQLKIQLNAPIGSITVHRDRSATA